MNNQQKKKDFNRFKENIVGKRLLEYRMARNIPQTVMAEMIGISYKQYNAYENQTRVPDVDMIQKIIKGLGVTADYLFGVREDIGSNQTELDICDYTGLSYEAVHQLHLLKERYSTLSSALLKDGDASVLNDIYFSNYPLQISKLIQTLPDGVTESIPDNDLLYVIFNYLFIATYRGDLSFEGATDIDTFLCNRILRSIDVNDLLSDRLLNDVIDKLKNYKMIIEKGREKSGFYNNSDSTELSDETVDTQTNKGEE